MRHPIALALLVLLLATGSAFAGKKAGVTMPDTITVGNTQLTLNGMGLREATFLKVDVYVAGLYLEKVSSNPQAIVASDTVKQIVLRFVRDVHHGDIVKAWNEGFKGNATVPIAKLEPYMQRLAAWTPDFKDGDTLIFTYVPGAGVSVDINGKRKGVINDADFARSLFNIWLGPKPPTGDLKKGMLGNHGRGDV